MSAWDFLTNHARVLFCITKEPGIRLREIAQCADITERTAHRIVDELVEAGYLTRHRVGARSLYEIHAEGSLRHQLFGGHQIGEILMVLLAPSPTAGDGRSAEPAGAASAPAPSRVATPT